MKILKNIVRDFKLKHRLRKTKRASYSLPDCLISPRKIIVLYPAETSLREMMEKFLRDLSELFHGARICIVGQRDSGIRQLSFIENSQKLEPSILEITWSGLPDKKFADKVRQLAGDILIDLSIRKDHFNGYLALCSEAAIRIGNFGSWGHPVYNFEIKSNYLQSEQMILNSFLEVLKTFRSGTNNTEVYNAS